MRTFNSSTEGNRFYTSMMAGLFAGIAVVLSSLIFAMIYRGISHFYVSQIVNITTVIFFSFIVSMLAGLVYYFIVPYARKNKMIYMAAWMALIAILIVLTFTIQRPGGIRITQQFHLLASGILLIAGLCDVLLIPYLSTHKNDVF